MEIYTNKVLNLVNQIKLHIYYASSSALVRDASPSVIELTVVTSGGRSMGARLEICSPSLSGSWRDIAIIGM